MTKGKRHKSKKYEQYYGEPYTLKTLVEVKRCGKCGREQLENSKARSCPYCGGSFIIKYVPKKA